MANLAKCKRCGKDIGVVRRNATNQRFCGADCRDTWWNEFRSKGVTRGEWMDRRFGEPERRGMPLEVRTWLAALIDGEGTISIQRERRKGNTSGTRYRAVVEIFNTNRQLLDQAAAFLDSFIARTQVSVKHARVWHKICYVLKVNRRAVLYVLEQLRPHLVAKARQADIVMDFCRAVRGAPMRSSLDHGMFEQLCVEVQALNKKGR